jgi:GcrA cell cycle regulator
MGSPEATWDVETAKALWVEGKSAGEISKVVGVTRNAVIGKMARLGLSRPRSVSNPLGFNGIKRPRKRRPHLERKAKQAEPAMPAPPPEAKNLSILELAKGTCRFATGFANGEHLFCGTEAITGSAYCEHHFQIAVRSYHEPVALRVKIAA